jgi:hypothetical protein
VKRVFLGAALAVAAVELGIIGPQGLAKTIASPLLAQVVLKPAQVGPGYRLVQRPDGHGVKYVTLDLCGQSFRSEAFRTDRLQVDYYTRSSTAVSLSNEVVVYKPGKARTALAEVRYVAQHCPSKPVVSPYGGPAIRYRLTSLSDAQLVQGYVALRVDARGVFNGKVKTITVLGVYQVKGDVLVGVYAYPGKGMTFAQTQKVGLHAAEGSARNLARIS